MAVGRRNARHDPRPLASDEHVSESKNPRSQPVLGTPIREENGHLAWHDASIPPALALWLRSGTRRKERLFVGATSLLRAATEAASARRRSSARSRYGTKEAVMKVMERAAVDGLELEYELRGSREPVVLIHWGERHLGGAATGRAIAPRPLPPPQLPPGGVRRQQRHRPAGDDGRPR